MAASNQMVAASKMSAAEPGAPIGNITESDIGIGHGSIGTGKTRAGKMGSPERGTARVPNPLMISDRAHAREMCPTAMGTYLPNGAATDGLDLAVPSDRARVHTNVPLREGRREPHFHCKESRAHNKQNFSHEPALSRSLGDATTQAVRPWIETQHWDRTSRPHSP
jgi:hypothetical protein